MSLLHTRRTPVVQRPVLYLRLQLLCLLQLLNHAIIGLEPLLPGVLPRLSPEVQEMHANQLPVRLCSGSNGTKSGRGC